MLQRALVFRILHKGKQKADSSSHEEVCVFTKRRTRKYETVGLLQSANTIRREHRQAAAEDRGDLLEWNSGTQPASDGRLTEKCGSIICNIQQTSDCHIHLHTYEGTRDRTAGVVHHGSAPDASDRWNKESLCQYRIRQNDKILHRDKYRDPTKAELKVSRLNKRGFKCQWERHVDMFKTY